MKFSGKTRFIAIVTFLVMLLNMLPVNLLVYAETASGIGVFNNAYTTDSSDYNVYKVELYYNDQNGVLKKLGSIPDISDAAGININAYGEFAVGQGRSVNLLDSTKFRSLINENNITEVRITFAPEKSKKECELYSSQPGTGAKQLDDGETTYKETVVYTILKEVPKKENGQTVMTPVYDDDGDLIGYEPVMVPNPLTDSDYSLSTFTSTEIIEHEVNVYWRDNGENRPDIEKI